MNKNTEEDSLAEFTGILAAVKYSLRASSSFFSIFEKENFSFLAKISISKNLATEAPALCKFTTEISEFLI